MSRKLVIAGRIITGLVGLFFLYNAMVKLFPEVFYPKMLEQMASIGLPASILLPIAILEIICSVAYMIPATSVLGAVLFTGYLGGAILTHLRVGESVVIHIVLGLVIWLGIYLREPRLHAILPIRKK